MDQRTKRQLVGAAVLVAGAVIFLPMLFTGPEEHDSLDVPLEIPPRPSFSPLEDDGLKDGDGWTDIDDLPVDEVPVPETAPEVRREAPPAEPAAAPEPAPQPPRRETAVPTPVESGYVVQVGSFSREENASAERDRIAGLGFTVFVDEVPRNGDVLYRVRVGPVVERDEARALLEELRDRANVEGYGARQG